MAQYVSLENIRFIIHEMLNAESLCELPRFQDHNKEGFDLTLDSTKAYADKVLYPSHREMDEDPARFEDGKIVVHPVVGQVMKEMGANGSIGANFNYEHGGVQLPNLIHAAAGHIAQSANNSAPGYTGLTAGAAHLIINYGSQELIDTYVPKMVQGEWGGTMCLTEPQAGSSLSDISSSATPQSDGSYRIKGQKIFISGGDHEYCENIVHLLLARIDGAPAGTRGISLFVVPKKRLTSEGMESNDVITAGDFQKMGQRGYATTHLVFGDNDDCHAWLVGAENQGLKHMFHMMNGARIDVGLTATSIATAAYYASLEYAKERPQGRRIGKEGGKNSEEPQTTIINHPDVRRMLLLQRAVTEGSLALLMQASLYQDLSEAGAEEEREMYHDLLELLTPIAKTYPSEMGRVSINNGLQVFGGYGFCTDFPLEQYYRDVRITSLYEGTTGIQSLDLLARKVVMKNGAAMKHLTKEVMDTIEAASKYDDLKSYADQLKSASKELQEVIMHLLQFAMQGEHERFISDATIFMELMSNVVLAWQWLKMAAVAKTALVTGNTVQRDSFYENKIHTMKFFFKYELPKIHSAKATLMSEDSLTIFEENEKVLN